jgi:acyl-CoA thioester hydrolase
MKIRVYYKHTDCGGIVYHSNYFDFCEMARSELFFSNGMSPTIEGCHFALKSIDSEFINYSKLGDMLEVFTKVEKIKNASVVISHEIKRDEVLIFKARAVLVFLCKGGKIGKIPTIYREFFERFS